MDKFIAHILVVDDDDGIRSLVKKYLNENKFLGTTAENAENAEDIYYSQVSISKNIPRFHYYKRSLHKAIFDKKYSILYIF